MAISLNPETQRMIEERMKQRGYASPDDMVRAASRCSTGRRIRMISTPVNWIG